MYVYICVDARLTAILDFQNGRQKFKFHDISASR